jgi:hypothetical protein
MENKLKELRQLILDYVLTFNVVITDLVSVEKNDRIRKERHQKIADWLENHFRPNSTREYNRVTTKNVDISSILDYNGGIDKFTEKIGSFEKMIDYLTYNVYQSIHNNSNLGVGYNCIELKNTYKFSIDEDFAKFKSKVSKRLEDCDKIYKTYIDKTSKWNKTCDKANEKRKLIYDNFGYTHDYNGCLYIIKNSLKIMEQFVNLPIEAYLDLTYDEYYTKRRKNIENNLKSMESGSFRIQQFMNEHPELESV